MSWKRRRAARPRLLPLMAGLLAVSATGAVAQEPLGSPQRERVEEIRLRFSRAQLGVRLGEVVEVGTRTGVRVQEAIPGGPAARAGVEAGDVVLAANDEALGTDPARRLRAIVREVAPGDTVRLLLNRDGRDRTVRVVTERAGPVVIGLDDVMRPEVLRPRIEGAVAEALGGLRALGRAQVQLTAMNPDLGRYFGVEEGVLVTDVAPESTLGLRAGDVLLSIGDREVRDPAHARGILASYRHDEEVEMRVVRERRTITVRGTPGEAAVRRR